jgi:hypothetical protein
VVVGPLLEGAGMVARDLLDGVDDAGVVELTAAEEPDEGVDDGCGGVASICERASWSVVGS